MTENDIDGVVALQRRAFPKMKPWTAHQLQSHMATFPEGQLVAVDSRGRVVGSASSLIVSRERVTDEASWCTITRSGTFRTHDAEGDVLYGADVGVDPDCRGLGIGAALYEARRELAIALGLRAIMAGGRIPGYGDVAHTMSAEQYVRAVKAGRLKDLVLGFQLGQGFRVRGLIERYIPSDHASKGFATLLEWRNPTLGRQPRVA